MTTTQQVKPSDPNKQSFVVSPKASFVSAKWTDRKFKELNKSTQDSNTINYGDTVGLVLKTKNMGGCSVSISVCDSDFLFNDLIMELSPIVIPKQKKTDSTKDYEYEIQIKVFLDPKKFDNEFDDENELVIVAKTICNNKEIEQKFADNENEWLKVLLPKCEKITNRKLIKVKQLWQKNLPTLTAKEKGCMFDAVIMALEGKLGKDIDHASIYNKAVEKGYVDGNNASVNNANELAVLCGLKSANLIQMNVDKNFSNNLKIQIDKNNPVIIYLPGHKETVVGYEYADNVLRFIVYDPGYQGDKYLDSKTLEVFYLNSKNNRVYSVDKTRTGDLHRKVEKAKYYA